jgi:hypothetical protein
LILVAALVRSVLCCPRESLPVPTRIPTKKRLPVNNKERFLKLLDEDIGKYEESAMGWQALRDYGDFPEQSENLITRSRNYAEELKELRRKVAAENI